MNQRSLLLALVLAGSALVAAEPSPRLIAFERGEDIWIAHLDGSGAKKIARGSSPDMSPDGKSVAFNTDEPSKSTPIRHIAIADFSSGEIHVLRDTPSDNCISPVWSPDGTELLFQLITNGWHIARIQPDGSGFRYVKKATAEGSSSWSTAWAPDGKSFYCQDLDNLYRCDLNGVELQKWNLHALLNTASLSSGARFAPSADGHSLLLDADLDEDTNRKGWDGPAPGLFLIDLEKNKAKRLSAKGSFDWSPRWISADEYLFISTSAGPSATSVYRQKVDGTGRKLVIKNGRTPSASRE